MKKIISTAVILLSMSTSALCADFATGSLELDKSLVSQAKGIRTLFLVIYDLDSGRPMPYGAQKVTLKADAKGKFYDFKLDSGSVRQMMPAPMPKRMRIKARLDRDGSAGMDRPGDIVGELKPVKVGAKNVRIVLSQVK